MSVDEAARIVLAKRLEVVALYRNRALVQPGRDLEDVHQLRVGTRRAGAALAIFKDCLPAKIHSRARNRLRQLRRAAGQARDWDVFLLSLASRTSRGRKPSAGLGWLEAFALGQRAAAQGLINQTRPRTSEKFDALLTKTVQAVQELPADSPAHSLRELAQVLVPELSEALSDAAGADLGIYENLHRVRILGKELRYAMEIVADCFERDFKERLYPQVEKMQDILGLANDSRMALSYLDEAQHFVEATDPKLWTKIKKPVADLERYHRQRLPRQRREFLKWWERWHHGGLEGDLLQLVNKGR
jgi:CHAD domain-containing protein